MGTSIPTGRMGTSQEPLNQRMLLQELLEFLGNIIQVFRREAEMGAFTFIGINKRISFEASSHFFHTKATCK